MKQTICVHGLGYIGLPTAAVLANQGYDVAGYDVNPDLRDKLTSLDFEFQETELSHMVEAKISDGKLKIVDEIRPAKYHLICVPTPINIDNSPNLHHVREAAKGIKSVLRQDDIVITESTVPPGTSLKVIKPILEETDPLYVSGETFGLFYCPETVLPGNIITELRYNDRIIGSIDTHYRQEAIDLYRSFCDGRLYQTDVTSAELTKIIQNASRDVNIAFANQVAKITNEYNLNSAEIIRLANTHPRVEILSPGPGVGGHCLPVDTMFLIHSRGDTSLIEASRQMNDSMASHVIYLLKKSIGPLSKKKIAILGVAYKRNVSDSRNSPALEIAELLRISQEPEEDSPIIALTDPNMSSEIYNIVKLDEAVAGADCIILVTDHDEYTDLNPEYIKKLMSGNIVLDTRNALDTEKWRISGLELVRL